MLPVDGLRHAAPAAIFALGGPGMGDHLISAFSTARLLKGPSVRAILGASLIIEMFNFTGLGNIAAGVGVNGTGHAE